jgi:hypothetical protein
MHFENKIAVVVLIIIQRIAAFIDHGVDLPSYFVAVRNE